MIIKTLLICSRVRGDLTVLILLFKHFSKIGGAIVFHCFGSPVSHNLKILDGRKALQNQLMH